MMNKLQQQILKLLNQTNIDIPYYISSSWYILCSYSIVVIKGFITTYCIARILSIEQFGVYRFMLSSFNIIGLLSAAGMAVAITKSIKNLPIDNVPIKHSIIIHSKISILGAVLLLAMVPLLFIIGRSEIWIAALVAALIYIPFYVSSSFFKGIVWSEEKINYLLKINVLELVTVTPIVLLLLFYYKSALLLLIPIWYIPTIIRIFYLVKLLKKYPSKSKSNEIIHYGLRISVYSIPLIFIGMYDDLLVSALFGLKELAIFSVAFLFPDTINALGRSLMQSTQARQSAGPDSKSSRNVLHKAVLWFMCISILGTTFYIILIPIIYPLLFPQYPQKLIFLSQIAALVGMFTPLMLCKQYLDGKGLIKHLRNIQIVSAVIGLLAFVLLINFFQVNGVVYARILFTVVYLGLCFMYTAPRRYID